MSFRFACYFPAEEPLFFTASVDRDGYIADLREVIHQKLKDLGQDVPLKELTLYKTDIPLEPDEDLTQRARQFLHKTPEALDMKKLVEKVFPSGPHRNERLDILVAIPSTALKRQPSGTLQNDQTKRPKHDFRQVVPRDGPNVITLKCIVVGEPACEIFDVEVRPDQNVILLKHEIKSTRDDLFQGIPLTRLQCFKVSLPVAQLKRGPAPPQGSELPAAPISSIFDPIQDHVQVLVSDRMDNPYLVIYNALWHREFPPGVTPFDPFTSKSGIQVLDFSPLTSNFPARLMRASYEEFWKYASNRDVAMKRSFWILLLGHPGIGKTTLLFVMLCWCLQKQIPVYYQPQDSIVYFFNNEGCMRLQANTFADDRARRPHDVAHYYLFDFNKTQNPPSVTFFQPRTVLIAASSPNPKQYKDWEKHREGSVQRWLLEPWTLEELNDYAEVCYGANEKEEREEIALRHARFGGSARQCFCDRNQHKTNEAAQDAQIDNVVANANVFFTMERSSLVAAFYPQVDGNGEFDRSQSTINFVSSYAASQITRRAQATSIKCIFQYYNELRQRRWSRTIAGAMFEEFAHRVLEKGLENAQLRPLFETKKKQKEEANQQSMITLTPAGTVFFDTPNLGQVLAQNKYLRPTSQIFPGIDSLMLDSVNMLNLFQITMNPSHGVKSDFLARIPLEHRTMMRLIFVMPDEGLEMKAQTVGGSKLSDVEIVKAIPQFVLTLRDEQIKAAV